MAVALIKTSKLNGINTPWVYVVSECFYVNMLWFSCEKMYFETTKLKVEKYFNCHMQKLSFCNFCCKGFLLKKLWWRPPIFLCSKHFLAEPSSDIWRQNTQTYKKTRNEYKVQPRSINENHDTCWSPRIKTWTVPGFI